MPVVGSHSLSHNSTLHSPDSAAARAVDGDMPIGKAMARLIGQGEVRKRSTTETAPPPLASLASQLTNETFGRVGLAYGMSAKRLGILADSRLFEAEGHGADASTEVEEGAAGESGPQSPEGETDAAPSPEDEQGVSEEEDSGHATRQRGADGEPLSDQELREVAQLKQRDTEIRAHEQAHLAAGQGYTRGGANFEYATGPDGRRYAVGGEVEVDFSEGSSPEQTVRKMQVVRRAALAPKNPSPQDRRVAAAANQRAYRARQEMIEDDLEMKREDRADREEEAEGPGSGDPGETRNTESPSESRSGLIEPPAQATGDEPPAADDGETLSPGSLSVAEGTMSIAQRLSAARAYAQGHRPEPMRPEVRSMQPGPPRQNGVTAVPTVKPQPGSVADISLLSS